MGHLSFVSLKKEHFPLLLKWLKATHVSCWYDKDTNWTTDKIQEKYTSYTEGFKLSDGVRKGLFAFVIAYDETPIGYIQYYGAYDFPRDGYALKDLPTSLAALDMLIGEEAYVGKGIGQKALALFLESHVHTQFDYVFVDPDRKNSAALKMYEKVGFRSCDLQVALSQYLMIRPQPLLNEIESLEKELLQPATRTSEEALDKMLADDFKEFGQSGSVYTKKDILEALPSEDPRPIIATNFEVK